jgi:hypothetical protein
MHILYLDESGTHSQARYFVVAGLAVFERETFFLARSLNQLQARYFPRASSTIPFHASSLKAPENRIPPEYVSLSTPQRWELNADIYRIIAESNARIFAVAIEKGVLENIEPYEYGFEQIVNRFDRMLARILRDRGEDQRGLIVVAESSYRENLELLANKIATEGHRWGLTHNLADIPYFAPAPKTRLLQLADFCANAIFARYETGHARDFDAIASKIDQDQGRLHGLVHVAKDRRDCYCLACSNRRAYPRLDPDDLLGQRRDL